MTRPVIGIDPKCRSSIGASRCNAVTRISPKPAAKTLSANAASNSRAFRRNAKASPAPAKPNPTAGHSGGSTLSAK